MVDIALITNLRKRPNNVETHHNQLELHMKAIIEAKRPTLYDPFSLHVQASATEFSHDLNNPDTEFSVDAGTPFEYEKIIGEYLI